MRIAGIDYSMSSPAIVVLDTELLDFDKCKMFAFAQSKKQMSSMENVKLYPYPDWSQDTERYAKLAGWSLGVCLNHGVEKVYLENYAYASTGAVFNIGENTGLLKFFLFDRGIPVETFTPGEIKKFATGKGNATKFEMYDAFVQRTAIELDKVLGTQNTDKKIPAPITDLVDAYWIAQLGATKT